jgi:hypothetical protein
MWSRRAASSLEKASRSFIATSSVKIGRPTSKGWARSRVLVVGNPPWVTNSELGQLGSTNLPTKSNFQGLRGFEARTGKSNFDIAEWMLLRLIDALPRRWRDGDALQDDDRAQSASPLVEDRQFQTGCARLFHIDAMADFGVAVDACLFFITGRRGKERVATMHNDLSTTAPSTRFGFVGGDLVSDIDAYQRNRDLDGGCSSYVWRSGVKHDAAKGHGVHQAGERPCEWLG